jgi:hypothetical protein
MCNAAAADARSTAPHKVLLSVSVHCSHSGRSPGSARRARTGRPAEEGPGSWGPRAPPAATQPALRADDRTCTCFPGAPKRRAQPHATIYIADASQLRRKSNGLPRHLLACAACMGCAGAPGGRLSESKRLGARGTDCSAATSSAGSGCLEHRPEAGGTTGTAREGRGGASVAGLCARPEGAAGASSLGGAGYAQRNGFA